MKPETVGLMAEQFSWVPWLAAPHTGPPVPIKSLALSAHVSCWTVHFQVLEESPLLGPGWGPLSCNSLCCSPRCRRSIHVPSAAIWVLSECLFQGQHLLPASVAAWLTTGCQVLNYTEKALVLAKVGEGVVLSDLKQQSPGWAGSLSPAAY